jgi:hypothetical protein
MANKPNAYRDSLYVLTYETPLRCLTNLKLVTSRMPSKSGMLKNIPQSVHCLYGLTQEIRGLSPWLHQ